MRLVAYNTPSLLPKRDYGRVHSVFRRAVNLCSDEGDLSTVYAGAADFAPPGAIAVHAPNEMDLSRHILHGAYAVCRGGVLRIEGSDVSIDLRTAQTHPAPDRSCPVSAPDDGAWRMAWYHLLFHSPPRGVATAFVGKPLTNEIDRALAARVRRSTPRLLAALRRARLAAALEVGGCLLGAGPGLTPSGDDFLTGFVLGAGRIGASRKRTDLVSAFARGLSARSHITGDISRIYLEHSAKGRGAQSFSDLADAIAVGVDRPALEQRIATALSIGHTSGSDAAFGLLCGFAVWRRKLTEIVEAQLVENSDSTACICQ